MSKVRDIVVAATTMAHMIDTWHEQFAETPQVLRHCANEILKLEKLLTEAQPIVCSAWCPSTWPSDEIQPHCDLCKQVTEALK